MVQCQRDAFQRPPMSWRGAACDERSVVPSAAVPAATWILELISGAETAGAGNRGHALGEGIEPAIGSSTASAAILGAPRSGVRSHRRYQQSRECGCDDRDLAHEHLLGFARLP